MNIKRIDYQLFLVSFRITERITFSNQKIHALILSIFKEMTSETIKTIKI